MRIYKLANLAQFLNDALGSGRYSDSSREDVCRRIDDGTIVEFLQEPLGFCLPITALAPVDRLELLLERDDMCSTADPFRFDATRSAKSQTWVQKRVKNRPRGMGFGRKR